MRLRTIILLCLFFCITSVIAQSDSALVYVWRNYVYAHNLRTHQQQELGLYFDGINTLIPSTIRDGYRLEDSPLDSVTAGYGFYHGVWSSDQNSFAYVLLESAGSGYQVLLYEDGMSRRLLHGDINTSVGYLDPIAWTSDGSLIMLERQQQQVVKVVRLWELDPGNGEPRIILTHAGSAIYGKTALAGGQVMLGFNPQLEAGYLFDLDTRSIESFYTPFELPETPRSVFELAHLPLAIMGVMNQRELEAFIAQIALSQPELAAPATSSAIPALAFTGCATDVLPAIPPRIGLLPTSISPAPVNATILGIKAQTLADDLLAYPSKPTCIRQRGVMLW